ncbi:hypothetical protein [Streptomyces sp. NPDC048357]
MTVARSVALFAVAALFDRPDHHDVIGAPVCLAGMAVIMYAPCGN